MALNTKSIGSFFHTAAKITEKVTLVVGFVMAVAAAFKAFSDTLKEHYTPKNETAE